MRRMFLLGLAVCLIASTVVVGSALAGGHGAGPSRSVHATLPLRAQPGKPFTVKIKVVQEKSETLALVPVEAHGEKLVFIVDTGAAQTQITTKVANQLGLAKAGKPVKITGVGCTSKAQPVTIDDWTIAGHALPTTTGSSSVLQITKGSKIAGLLGSDVWSQFGSIKVDYANETLTIG